MERDEMGYQMSNKRVSWKATASVREYVFYVFSGFKKHDFLRFFEVTCQKVVKSH